MRQSDVIIVGLGTVGAAVCLSLARRHVAVLGLDARHPPHRQASHHGESRSIRRAYMEGTAYVPMAVRAWELWRRLERDTATALLTPAENLTIGPPDAPAVSGFMASARAYDIPHDVLSAADVRRRWPQLTPPDGFVAGLERRAGVIRPEAAVSAMLGASEAAGAMLRFREPVVGWSDLGDRIEVHTHKGRMETGRLLLAAGARNAALLGPWGRHLSPKRVPVHWVVPPAAADFELGAFPVNFWQLPAAESGGAYGEFYALPVVRSGGRVKAAPHNHLADWDLETESLSATPDEVSGIRWFLQRHIPILAEQDLHSDGCLYTVTPDGDFCLGPLPGHRGVCVAALAGHGFKFATVLGDILADLLTGAAPEFDVGMFAPDRFDQK